MKKLTILFILLHILYAAILPALADEDLFNPSFYSAGSIAYETRNYWQANYLEIQELMNKYPDFQCEYYPGSEGEAAFDQIICTSVNNKFSRDVIINFWFDGDHNGMTGLREAVFTLTTPDTVSVQETLEYFWIENAYPWHESSEFFYDFGQSLVFQTATTTMRFDLANFNTEYSNVTTVDFWQRGSSRMGVG